MSKINTAKANNLGSVVETRNEVERVLGTSFGLGSVTDTQNELTRAVTKLLAGVVTTEAVDLLNGIKDEPLKAPSLWEKYIPTIKHKDDMIAAKYVLDDNRNGQDWKLFLNDPEVEAALIEDVGFKLLEDLSSIATFLDKEKELIEEWKVIRPQYYNNAALVVEDYTKKVFTPEELKKPENKDGIEAFKLTRLAAYRVLDAHFTGNTTFEMSPQLGGASYVTVKLKSPALDNLQKTDPFAVKQLSFLKLGAVRTVTYDILEKRKYTKLYESIIRETDPKNFKGAGMAFSSNHCVQAVSQKICPMLSREADYFRQKNFDPEVMYALYASSKKLQFLSVSSLYPLLGTGGVPAQMPPDFVERFPKSWRQKNGISLKAIAYAGFAPIVHCKLDEIIDDLYKNIPDMQTELMSPDTMNHLKLAKTMEVVVEPIKAAAIQREIAVAYKKSYPKDFDKILTDAEGEVGHLKASDNTLYTLKLRNEVFGKILNSIQRDPDKSIEELETRLLQDKKDEIVAFDLPKELVWARDLKTGRAIPMDNGEIQL